MLKRRIRAIGMVARISEKNLYLYRNNAVTDIFIACHDNLTGLGDAINAIFPKTRNQFCIVHQIRNSCKFVPYKDRKAVCADLKKIYGAVNLDDAEYAKEEFREKWDKKYPSIISRKCFMMRPKNISAKQAQNFQSQWARQTQEVLTVSPASCTLRIRECMMRRKNIIGFLVIKDEKFPARDRELFFRAVI